MVPEILPDGFPHVRSAFRCSSALRSGLDVEFGGPELGTYSSAPALHSPGSNLIADLRVSEQLPFRWIGANTFHRSEPIYMSFYRTRR